MDWLAQNLWALWLGLALLLIAAEMMSLDLILLMLAAGSFAAMGTSLVGGNAIIQVLVAVGVALAMLLLVRPNLVKRLHKETNVKFGTDRWVGARGVTTEEITPLQSGRVRVAGEDWTAQSENGTTIAIGETVEVVEVRGATAVVRRTEGGE